MQYFRPIVYFFLVDFGDILWQTKPTPSLHLPWEFDNKLTHICIKVCLFFSIHKGLNRLKNICIDFVLVYEDFLFLCSQNQGYYYSVDENSDTISSILLMMNRYVSGGLFLNRENKEMHKCQIIPHGRYVSRPLFYTPCMDQYSLIGVHQWPLKKNQSYLENWPSYEHFVELQS